MKNRGKDKKITIRLSSRDYSRLQEFVSGESMSAFIRKAIHSEVVYQEAKSRRDRIEMMAKIYEYESE